jgi:hypothetical protein
MSDLLRSLIPMHENYLDNTLLQDRLRLVNVFKKYDIFFGEHRFSEYFIDRKPINVTIIDPRGHPQSLENIRIRSYRHYYEIARQGCADAREYFGI